MLKEVDLHEPCKKWLEGKKAVVRSEVKDIDMMGILSDEVTIAIEMKLSLNLEVINQAVQRQKLVDYVYIATVHNSKTLTNKRTKLTMDTLRRLNLGWISVNFKASPPKVQVLLEAKDFDMAMSKNRNSKSKERLIREFNNRSGDFNKGGSTRKKLMTAYREEALKIAYALSLHDQASVKELKAMGTHKDKTSPILNSNFYKWFTKVERGIYALSDTGQLALKEHQDLIPHMRSQLIIKEGQS